MQQLVGYMAKLRKLLKNVEQQRVPELVCLCRSLVCRGDVRSLGLFNPEFYEVQVMHPSCCCCVCAEHGRELQQQRKQQEPVDGVVSDRLATRQ